MSELEDFIKNNRAEFDQDEPIEGHQERFLRKLERLDEKQDHSRVMFWRIAAAVIVLVVLCVSVLVPRFNSPADVQYGSMSLGDVSDELADVEMYYQSKLSQEYAEVNKLSQSDPVVKSYMDELNRLNQEYDTLEAKLYESGSHEKVVLAMIENFRTRLMIIERLEEKKNIEITTKQDTL